MGEKITKNNLKIFAVGFYPPRVGGSAQAGWNIAKELARRGHKLKIFSESMSGNKTENLDGVEIIQVKTKRPLTPSVKNYALAKFSKQIPGIGADVAKKPFNAAMEKEHAHWEPDVILVNFSAPFASFVLGFAKKHNIPVVSVFHGSDAHSLIAPEYKKVKEALAKSYRKVDEKIAVANYLKSILETMGFEDIKTIPNAIDKDIFKANARDKIARFRNKLGITKNAVVLTHISTLRPIKRPLDIVNAAKIAVEKEPNLFFLIVGDGPLRSKMEFRINELGLNKNFKFVGQATQHQINDYLNASEALLLPSEREGMPLVILEAAASGKPTIASSVGGVPEIIKHKVNGLLFEKGDLEQFAARMVSIANPELRKQLSEGALSCSRKKDISKMAQKYELVIRNAIKEKQSKKDRYLRFRRLFKR